MTIRNSILMAYLDGQLPETEAAEVAAEIETSPSVKAAFEKLQQDNNLLVQTFGVLDKKPIRKDTMDLIENYATSGKIAEKRATNIIAFAKKPQTRPSLWITAIAASVALFVGVGSGIQFASISPSYDNQTSLAYAQQSAGRITAANALFDVLENHPSLVSGNLDQLGSAVATPRTSFRSSNGAYCREYEVSSALSASHNVACRDENSWVIQVATTMPVVTATNKNSVSAGNYFVASQEDNPIVSAAIRSMITGDALSADEEGKMITRKWQ